MAKKPSKAPKERINIKYVPATGDQQAELELPLRMVVLGDFTGKPDETVLEERKVLSVDKNSFNSVMAEAGLEQTLEVKNTLSDEDDATITTDLKFSGLKDFAPDSVINQVPELKKLADLRESLVALKGPLGNMPAFRRAIQSLLQDEEKRKALLDELSKGKFDAQPEDTTKKPSKKKS